MEVVAEVEVPEEEILLDQFGVSLGYRQLIEPEDYIKPGKYLLVKKEEIS